MQKMHNLARVFVPMERPPAGRHALWTMEAPWRQSGELLGGARGAPSKASTYKRWPVHHGTATRAMAPVSSARMLILGHYRKHEQSRSGQNDAF